MEKYFLVFYDERVWIVLQNVSFRHSGYLFFFGKLFREEDLFHAIILLVANFLNFIHF